MSSAMNTFSEPDSSSDFDSGNTVLNPETTQKRVSSSSLNQTLNIDEEPILKD